MSTMQLNMFQGFCNFEMIKFNDKCNLHFDNIKFPG